MKSHLLYLCILFCAFPGFSQEIRGPLGSLVFMSAISSDHVNVRDYPSREGRILSQLNNGDKIRVTGFSEKPETIDNQNGYWLRIALPKSLYIESYGWVFSKFVSDCSDLKPRSMTVSFEDQQSPMLPEIRFTFGDGDVTGKSFVYVENIASQDYYTFCWNEDIDDYSYRDVPGTYTWNPASGELRHISYIGNSGKQSSLALTEDSRFLIRQMIAIGPVLKLAVWDLEKRSQATQWNSIDGINLEGHQIDIVCPYYKLKTGKWDLSPGKYDAETAKHAELYFKDNPPPSAEIDPEAYEILLVRYRLDLETGRRHFEECAYRVSY